MSGARGEAYLRVGEEEVALLFTNRALAEAERVTGKTVLQLMRGAQGDALGIGDVAALFAVGMENARRESHAGGRTLTLNDAWRIMDVVGFANVAKAVFEAITVVVSWQGEEERAPDGATANEEKSRPLGQRPGTGGSS